MKQMRVTAENKENIKNCIKSIPKSIYDYYNGNPYELMIYVKLQNDNWDLDDVDYFKGMRGLEKTIGNIIEQYGNKLSHIDFKWSDEENEYCQFTIYKA